MPQWNAAQYLTYEKQRTQPAIDLAGRVPNRNPRRVLDVGCGPGNSTAVLAEQFPGADILGVDSSESMIAAARERYPALSFQLADASRELDEIGRGCDLVFSNACLQWIPDHPRLIPRLLSLLHPGGTLAVQVPVNQEEPIHRIIGETAASPAWASYFAHPRFFHTLTPGGYYDLLAREAASCEIWQTAYIHVMPSHEAILDWYRGTGLRPYLEALPTDKQPMFEAEVYGRLTQAYPRQADGRILFPFPRFFFLAER